MKVGDRIRVLVRDSNNATVEVGDTGTVLGADHSGLYTVMDGECRRADWREEQQSRGHAWDWVLHERDVEVIADAIPTPPVPDTAREAFLSRLRDLYMANVNIASRKNADYAKGNDPFQNFRMCEHYGVSTAKGLLIRMSDKLVRISNLLDKDSGASVADESIKDACSDLANYAMQLRIWLETKEADAAATAAA